MTTDSRPARRSGVLAAIVVAVVALLLLRWTMGGSDPASYHEEIHPARMDARAPAVAPVPAAKPADAEAAAAAAPGTGERARPGRLLRVVTNVPGAVVTVQFHHIGSEPETEPRSAVCDAKGEASFPVPEHPDYLVFTSIEARAEGYATAAVSWADDPVIIELMLEAPGEKPDPAPKEPGVSGRVSFPDGRPVPGVQIEASISEGSFYAENTSESGEFEFESSWWPRFTLECPYTGEKREVDAGTRGIEFVIREHVVRTRFVDGKGRPFRFVQWHHETRVEGKVVDKGQNNVSVTVPAGGVLWITPSAPGYPRTVTKVPVEGPPAFHDVAVVMEKLTTPGTVAVRMRTDTGDPPARVYLVAKNEMGHVLGLVGAEGEIKRDAEGRILFEGLPPGRVVVEANTELEHYANAVPKDYGLPTSVEALVEAGKTVPVDLIVPLGGKIALTVRGPDGTVAAPGEIRVRDDRGEPVAAKFWAVAAGGEKSWPPDRATPAFLDDPLPPGRYTMEILREEKVVSSKSIAVPRGATLEVEIRLDR